MMKQGPARPLLLMVMTTCLLAAATPAATADPPDAKREGTLALSGVAIDPLNVSAIVARDGLLAIGSDEGSGIQVFKKTGPGAYQATAAGPIDLAPGRETDIEGMAWGPEYLYVIGSHSLVRKEAKEKKSVAENHARLAADPTDEPARKQLFRLKLDADGVLVPGSIEQITLDDAFKRHPILARFRDIPSKENGIDIEGLALDGDGLVVGFRGPSLRGPVIPVLAVSFTGGRFSTDTVKTEDRFLDLGGRGIRAMTEAPGGGFLVLGGPVGDEPTSYKLYYWDGRDALIGKDAPDAKKRVRTLCRIGCPDVDADGKALSDRLVDCSDSHAKAEGLEAVEAKGGTLRFIVAYDTAIDGAPTLFSCPFSGG